MAWWRASQRAMRAVIVDELFEVGEEGHLLWLEAAGLDACPGQGFIGQKWPVRHGQQEQVRSCSSSSMGVRTPLGRGANSRPQPYVDDHGVCEAKYAAIDNISSTVRLVTVAFMSCVAVPARVPFLMS
jgi:hypothetical protein